MIDGDEFGENYTYHFKQKENAIQFLLRQDYVDWAVDPTDLHFLRFINAVYRPGVTEEEMKNRFYHKEEPSKTAFIEDIHFMDEEE